MDFFQSQESLTAIQWVLRAIVAFFFLLFATKIMGQRSISQLRLLDFAMAITLGNIIAHPLSDEGLGMKGSMITITVLVFLYLIGVFLSLKWITFRHFIDAPPIPLIKNGKIISKNLRRARISVDFLLTELRKEKIEEVQNVALALWEPDGSISSFLHTQLQTTTRTDLNLKPQPFFLPIILSKEGKIDYRELQKTKHTEDWLHEQLTTTHKVNIKNILLATIDQHDNLQIFLY
ncbi:DUF421 domain-containing protein [Lysinibacillus fusiformis]|uniref:DUF421 domain-containing protein n=1 Tax=Lysinibacillus fusiformis TaxID=28031 RepID=UPI0023A9201D|nr:DUF421 domain-containing protein [Lysinibacillus fusiformis]WEA41393.1 DUF421 domain-containing protein [Lysinibacillus fusiformis]